MLLLLALVVAVAWSLVRGGRIPSLHPFPLRGWELALAAFGLQVGVILILPGSAENLLRVSIFILSYALLAIVVWWNRQQPGVWLLGLGLAANWLVILANGGYMPVSLQALEAAGKTQLVSGTESGTLVLNSKDILLPLADTRLWFLSDIFVIPPPFPVPTIFSAGDALLALGLVRFVGGVFRPPTSIIPRGGTHVRTSTAIPDRGGADRH
jgi:hypothetical protein